MLATCTSCTRTCWLRTAAASSRFHHSNSIDIIAVRNLLMQHKWQCKRRSMHGATCQLCHHSCRCGRSPLGRHRDQRIDATAGRLGTAAGSGALLTPAAAAESSRSGLVGIISERFERIAFGAAPAD